MKKSLLISVLALVFTAALAFTCASVSTAKDKPIIWKMSTPWPTGNDYFNVDKHFVNVVHEMAGGRLQIKLHPGGEIVPMIELLPAVQNNVLQAASDWPGFWIGRNSAFNILAGFPMSPQWTDVMTWIYVDGGHEIFNEVYGQYGMYYFPFFTAQAEAGIRGRPGSKKLKSLEDFKGAKIRMAGRLQGYILKKLGAASVTITPDEIYQSLERGLVDYAEYAYPHVDWSIGLHEVTKEWNLPGWHQCESVMGVMMNKKAYDELPKDLQAVIKYAAQATMLWSSGRSRLLSGVYTDKFLERGTHVNILDDASLDQIQKWAYEAILEEAKANPLYAKAAYLLFKTAQKARPFESLGEMPIIKRKAIYPDMEALKKAAGPLLKE